MFNIGGGELIVIMLIALIVLGPQRLPDAARQVGKTMGDLRRLSSGFQNEMKGALSTADDPTRVAARRNVLAKEPAPTDDSAARAQGSARKAPLKAVATKNGAAATSPATPRASKKKAPAKKAAAPRSTAKKPVKTATSASKRAAPAAKAKSAAIVSKAAPRRTKS